MIRFEDKITGHSTYWYDASDLAKFLMIKVDGKIIGRNKFLQLLRANGYLMKDSNQPCQAWITMNMARWHVTVKRHKKYGMPIFHERSIAYLQKKIANGDIQLIFEKRKDKHIVRLQDVC